MRHPRSLLIVVALLGASCGGTDAALNPTQPSSSPLARCRSASVPLHRWLSRRG